MQQAIKADANGFVDLLNRVVPTSANKGFYDGVISQLSAADYPLAKRVLDEMPDSMAKHQLTISAFGALCGQNVEAALQEASKCTGNGREAAFRGIAKQLANEDFNKALTVAKGEEAPLRQAVLREVARATAYRKPENAVTILQDPVLSREIGTDFRQEMLNTTVTTWAKQDLSAAQQWVEKLPEADAAKGYQGLMTSWMKTDPVAASEWLSKQALGPARDAGAKVLIEQIKDTDPERAEQWRKSLAPAKE